MTAISNPGAPDGRNNWEDDPANSVRLIPGEWIGSTVEDLRGAYRFATELSREWGIRVQLRIDANSGGFEVFAA